MAFTSLVDAQALAAMRISDAVGPFGPQIPPKALRKLAALSSRRALYLHFADDSAARLRYRDVLALMASRCQGCEIADASHVPTFGGLLQHPACLNELGQLAHRRVLLALSHELNVTCCPALCDLIGLLLISLSEEEAFAVARTLVDRSCKALAGPKWKALFYLPTDSVSRQVFNRTFAVVAGIDPGVASAWMDRLLVTVLPLNAQLCLLDHLVVKGAKTLYRFGLAVVEKLGVSAADLPALVLRAEPVVPSTGLACVPPMSRRKSTTPAALDFYLVKKRNFTRSKLLKIEATLGPIQFRPEPSPPPHISRQALAQSKLEFSDFALIASWLEPHWQDLCAAKLKHVYSTLVHGADLMRLLGKVSEDSAHVLAVGLLCAEVRCVIAVYCPPGALTKQPSKRFTGDGTLFLARVAPPPPKVCRMVALESSPMFSCRSDGLWIGSEPALFLDPELKTGFAKPSTVLQSQGLIPEEVKHDLSDANAKYFEIAWVELFAWS